MTGVTAYILLFPCTEKSPKMAVYGRHDPSQVPSALPNTDDRLEMYKHYEGLLLSLLPTKTLSMCKNSMLYLFVNLTLLHMFVLSNKHWGQQAT